MLLMEQPLHLVILRIQYLVESATFTAAYGAIYNDDQSDKLCVVLDFSGNKTATNGTFKVSFPDPSTPADAIISMA